MDRTDATDRNRLIPNDQSHPFDPWPILTPNSQKPILNLANREQRQMKLSGGKRRTITLQNLCMSDDERRATAYHSSRLLTAPAPSSGACRTTPGTARTGRGCSSGG